MRGYESHTTRWRRRHCDYLPPHLHTHSFRVTRRNTIQQPLVKFQRQRKPTENEKDHQGQRESKNTRNYSICLLSGLRTDSCKGHSPIEEWRAQRTQRATSVCEGKHQESGRQQHPLIDVRPRQATSAPRQHSPLGPKLFHFKIAPQMPSSSTNDMSSTPSTLGLDADLALVAVAQLVPNLVKQPQLSPKTKNVPPTGQHTPQQSTQIDQQRLSTLEPWRGHQPTPTAWREGAEGNILATKFKPSTTVVIP